MGARRIDQFCAGFATGDAISNMALLIQNALRQAGFESEIFTEQYMEADSERVRSYKAYAPRKDAVLLYHHSFETDILKQLPRYPGHKVLVFHNVTPPQFVEPYNPRIARSLAFARSVLAELRTEFDLAFSVSHFNTTVLKRLGYEDVQVLPPPISLHAERSAPTPAHLSYLDDGRTNVLFVGRVFPNKRHQDILKAFYFYRQLDPHARLILAGPFHPGVRGYTGELFNLSHELQLDDAVVFTDMVSEEEINAYYRASHLFLSMSEHEGLFVPLLESMHFGLPILAYRASVIPETLGGSGVEFTKKDYPLVAELMFELVHNSSLRDAVLNGQNQRLAGLDPARSTDVLLKALERLVAGHLTAR